MSPSTDNCQALQRLRDTNCIGNDIAILIDEMHLQPQVQFDGQTFIGCNADMVMYTSIVCFIIVSLKKSIPFVHRRSTRSGWSGHGRTTFLLAQYKSYGAAQFNRTSYILLISLAGPLFSPVRRPCCYFGNTSS